MRTTEHTSCLNKRTIKKKEGRLASFLLGKADKLHSGFDREKRPKLNRTKSAVILVVLAVFSSGATGLFSQKSPKDKFDHAPLHPIQMPEVKEVTFPNGLRLFLVEDHEFPTVDIRAMVKTGSVYEPSEKAGLAAIAGEVLRTGGTAARSGDDIDKDLETMAATLETSIGETSGYIRVSMLKEDVDRVLTLLADILLNPVFREEKIELAKIRQKTSIARRNDDIGQITRREFEKIIYGEGSPYARYPEYATVDAVTREDVANFYKTYFHPNNARMAVWGDFDAGEMEAKISEALGPWAPSDAEVPPLPEVHYEYKYTVNFIDRSDVNQSNIMLGHIGGVMNNPDYPALSVMNSILSYDRMFKKIRTDEGLAYSVWGAYGAGFRNPGAFSAGTQTKSESTVLAVELMLKEIKRITKEEVTDEELAKAKDEYLNSYVFNFDSRAKIVGRMMTYAFYGYPLDFIESFKDAVEKVTKADVLRVAETHLQPDKVQILVVGNKEKFDKALTSLGEVNVVDITIPALKKE